MATIFSGMQPTGRLHLGALQQWVQLAASSEHQAIFCIVDAHALTVAYDPKVLRQRVEETALAYLAAGVNPDRCSVFVQSEVKEHFELAWYLSCVAPMGSSVG